MRSSGKKTGRNKALVTGGLGFVGSALVAHLAREGWQVVVYDNCSRGSRKNLEGVRAQIVVADIVDGRSVRRCVDRFTPEVIFHLAAMHFLPQCNADPVGCIRDNVIGTENVLHAAEAAFVTTVVVPTSMAVYPISDKKVCEEDSVGPFDIYGETKVMNEMQMRRWCVATGKRAIAVRLANVYGPRETNPHVIPAIMIQLKEGCRTITLGTVDTYRDYIHVDDVARAFASLATAEIKQGLHMFNLGTGVEHSLREVLAMLEGILGRRIRTRIVAQKQRAIERIHLWPDIRKIARTVDWHPRVDLKDGLRDLCEWYHIA